MLLKDNMNRLQNSKSSMPIIKQDVTLCAPRQLQKEPINLKTDEAVLHGQRYPNSNCACMHTKKGYYIAKNIDKKSNDVSNI